MNHLNTKYLHRLIVLCLLLIGAGLRLVRFGQVPPGLYHDEAQNGMDALSVLEGELPVFFEANNGREPLYIYLVALSVGILGRSPISVRLPSFFVGFLTLAATYDMVRAFFNRKNALYALAILTVTFWHIHLSRVGYRAVLLPLFTAFYLSAVTKAIRLGKRHNWIIGGVFYGASWYTYMAARFTPVAIAIMLCYVFLTKRAWLLENHTKLLRNLCYFAVSAILVLLPLGLYALNNPDTVLARSGQVSIFNHTINHGNFWGTLLRHTLKSIGMFIIKGDRIWRHNLSFRPVWTAGISVAFVIGLGVTLAGFRKRIDIALPLLWTCVMLVPTLLAEDAPHFLRGVGVLPTAVMLPTLGLSWIQNRLVEWISFKRQQNTVFLNTFLPSIVPWLLVILSAVFSIYAYFVTYAESPLVYHWFESGPVELAQTINTLTGQGWHAQSKDIGATKRSVVCIDPKIWHSWTAVPFLVPEETVQLLPSMPPSPEPGIVFVVWPYEDWHQTVDANLPHPSYLYINDGPAAQGDLDPEPFTIARFIHADPIPPVPPYVARFGNGLGLRAALVEFMDENVIVNLWWDTTIVQDSPATVFVHYIRNGERIAQNDRQPGDNQLPTTLWVPGDLILDKHHLAGITPDTNTDKLRIGLYHSDNGENIPQIDGSSPAESWYETNIIFTP